MGRRDQLRDLGGLEDLPREVGAEDFVHVQFPESDSRVERRRQYRLRLGALSEYVLRQIKDESIFAPWGTDNAHSVKLVYEELAGTGPSYTVTNTIASGAESSFILLKNGVGVADASYGLAGQLVSYETITAFELVAALVPVAVPVPVFRKWDGSGVASMITIDFDPISDDDMWVTRNGVVMKQADWSRAGRDITPTPAFGQFDWYEVRGYELG